MAKKKRKTFPPVTEDSARSKPKSSGVIPQSRTRWELIALFFVIAIGGTYLAVWMKPRNAIPEFTFELVQKVPHDKQAFTQGLVFENGFLYESTGLNGKSSLRKVELETGKVLKQLDLEEAFFGEGLTVFNGKLIQLTWQNNKGIVYRETEEGFEEERRFSYDHEGWGITHDGTQLIMSDGSANLRYLDPETYEETIRLYTRRKDRRVIGQLNELEYFGSEIYANIYNSDKVYRINAETGDVEAIIDLTGLWPYSERPGREAVLNGIAIKPDSRGTMWVTGKYCPYVYEIKIVPKE